ncbi:hypothetical protein JCM12298_26720 [Desulfothermus naphthae]
MIFKVGKKIHSQTLNKWRKRLEKKFDFEAEGDRPTEKMEDSIEKIEEIIVDKTKIWYKIGAKRGIQKFIEKILNQEIQVKNTEDGIELVTNIDKIEWEKNLKIKVGNKTKKEKVKITLSFIKDLDFVNT